MVVKIRGIVPCAATTGGELKTDVETAIEQIERDGFEVVDVRPETVVLDTGQVFACWIVYGRRGD